MDSISARSREVEKPKTVTEKRAALILELEAMRIKLEGQAAAVRVVFGSIPIVGWLATASTALQQAIEELERTRR